METEQDKLVYEQPEPDIGELVKEYEHCTPVAHGWNRLQSNDDTRFARWKGQSADGKKHNTDDDDAFPWEGASDSQVFLADAIINENVAVMMMAFQRSVALAKGVEPNDFEQAAYRTKLLEWLTGTKLKAELTREVELAAQYMETYGAFVMHPTWEREVRMKADMVTLEKLAEIGQQNPESPVMMLAQLIANPETEDQAVALVQEFGKNIAKSMAMAQLNGDESELFENYEVKANRARRFVRELRDMKASSLPIPYICKNQPCITTLRLWDDVFIPPYVTDIQKAPYVFVKYMMSEQELRSKAALEGWDKEWVEKAVLQKGRESTWASSGEISSGTVTGNTTSDGDVAYAWLEAEQTQHSNVEVICAYTQQLDEDDIPSINYTIFHANITKNDSNTRSLYAKSERLDYQHKQMPFVVGMRERWNRSITSSRGVPQMLASRQREIKVQRDSIVDATSLSTVPPIHTYTPGVRYRFGPAVQNHVIQGREPKPFEIPTRETAAFELMERFEREVKEEMGILSEDIPAPRVQVKQQRLVSNFLSPITEAFQQMFALIEQYMPDQMFMEITGSQQPLPKGELISLQKDFILTFDVREMAVEHMTEEFKAISEHVLPNDREGVISPSKLVRSQLRALNPSLAKEITMDANQASEQLKNRVQDDFVRMFAGMEPRLTPDDNPTAATELQIASELMQMNPKMQKAMQEDMDFQEKANKWFENRTFNVQQNNNKRTGRMGVAA